MGRLGYRRLLAVGFGLALLVSKKQNKNSRKIVVPLVFFPMMRRDETRQDNTRTVFVGKLESETENWAVFVTFSLFTSSCRLGSIVSCIRILNRQYSVMA